MFQKKEQQHNSQLVIGLGQPIWHLQQSCGFHLQRFPNAVKPLYNLNDTLHAIKKATLQHLRFLYSFNCKTSNAALYLWRNYERLTILEAGSFPHDRDRLLKSEAIQLLGFHRVSIFVGCVLQKCVLLYLSIEIHSFWRRIAFKASMVLLSFK